MHSRHFKQIVQCPGKNSAKRSMHNRGLLADCSRDLPRANRKWCNSYSCDMHQYITPVVILCGWTAEHQGIYINKLLNTEMLIFNTSKQYSLPADVGLAAFTDKSALSCWSPAIIEVDWHLLRQLCTINTDRCFIPLCSLFQQTLKRY